MKKVKLFCSRNASNSRLWNKLSEPNSASELGRDAGELVELADGVQQADWQMQEEVGKVDRLLVAVSSGKRCA